MVAPALTTQPRALGCKPDEFSLETRKRQLYGRPWLRPFGHKRIRDIVDLQWMLMEPRQTVSMAAATVYKGLATVLIQFHDDQVQLNFSLRASLRETSRRAGLDASRMP